MCKKHIGERHWSFISELCKPGCAGVFLKSSTIKTYYLYILAKKKLVIIGYKLQSSRKNQYFFTDQLTDFTLSANYLPLISPWAQSLFVWVSGFLGLEVHQLLLWSPPARITFYPLRTDSAEMLSWLYGLHPYLGSSANCPCGPVNSALPVPTISVTPFFISLVNHPPYVRSLKLVKPKS